MDAVLYIVFALGLYMYYSNRKVTTSKKTAEEVEDITRVAKLNDTFYEDPNAFMKIANALGFPRRE